MLYREMEHQDGMAEALCVLGKVEAARGDHAFARSLYEETLAMAQEIGDKELIASGLKGPTTSRQWRQLATVWERRPLLPHGRRDA